VSAAQCFAWFVIGALSGAFAVIAVLVAEDARRQDGDA
jgi:hypothetical protein